MKKMLILLSLFFFSYQLSYIESEEKRTFPCSNPSDPLLFDTTEDFSLYKNSPLTTSLASAWNISFHQQILSMSNGPKSHFYPTSSEYMKRALLKYGTLGYFLGMDRLLRENSDRWIYPLIQIGSSVRKYDPIP